MSEHPVAINTRVGNDYRNWKHTARELLAGSEVMRRERLRHFATLKPGKTTLDETPPEFFTTWAELMLTAFGIQCLIKAIWLTQGNQLARDGRYVPMTITNDP